MKRYSNVIEPEADTDSDTEADNRLTEAEPEKALPPLFTLYEQNFGIITPMIAEKLKAIEVEFPPDWIPKAFSEAVNHNARNIAYVTTILDRWKRDGPGSTNGKPRRGKQEVDRNSEEGRKRYALSSR